MSEVYLRSIDRRWKKELETANGKVTILSPYLTSSTAEAIITKVPSTNCEVYTLFSVENFASGASSIKTLRNLFDAGYALFHLPRLHAKIVLVSERLATIGSQNLTANGIRNREASLLINSQDEVREIEEALEPWLVERQAISAEMVSDVERLLPQVRRLFLSSRRAASDLEKKIWSLEVTRERQKEEERKRLNRKIRRRNRRIAEARTTVTPLIEITNVPRELAVRFLKKSAWWHHPYGPRRAPRHSDRMYGVHGDWKIEFGANTFLVGRAISRCAHTIDQYLNTIEQGNDYNRAELVEKLMLNVRGAVANWNGYEYQGYYDVQGNDMMFGTQSIDVDDFVQFALDTWNIDEPITELDGE